MYTLDLLLPTNMTTISPSANFDTIYKLHGEKPWHPDIPPNQLSLRYHESKAYQISQCRIET